MDKRLATVGTMFALIATVVTGLMWFRGEFAPAALAAQVETNKINTNINAQKIQVDQVQDLVRDSEDDYYAQKQLQRKYPDDTDLPTSVRKAKAKWKRSEQDLKLLLKQLDTLNNKKIENAIKDEDESATSEKGSTE